MRVIMDEFDKVFLSYWKILDKLKILKIKTKNDKEITHKDLLEKNPKQLWTEDMCFLDLANYFHRKKDTVYRAIVKMAQENLGNTLTYYNNDKLVVSKEGIEWLCKNCFKQKYLDLLEEYKMELTERYIEAGYIYDEFFGMN